MSLTRAFSVLALPCCVAFLSIGCAPATPVGGNANAGSNASGGTSITLSYVAPTNEECDATGKQIENAVMVTKTGFGNLMDWETLFSQSTSGLGLNPADEAGFHSGLRQSASGPNGLTANLTRVINQGSTYTYLRTRDKEGTKRALFRLVGPQGLNYHDLVLSKQPDGTIRIVDLYIYASGELLSETFRRGALATISAESNRSLWDKLSGKQGEFVKHMQEFQSMATSLQSGNFHNVMNIYRQLPQSMQEDKTVLLMRYQAAVNLGINELKAVSEDMQRLFPTDACMNLLLIDYYAVQQDFKKAQETVDRLDQDVQDPYLHVLRSQIYMAEGNHTEAQRTANEARAAGFSL